MNRILQGGLFCSAIAALTFGAISCRGSKTHAADAPSGDAALATVGVTRLQRKPLERQLTVSSELVPFQEIEVYAKEAGYVKDLYVDYGSRVKAGDVMAVLDIPELELQLEQDDATVKNASNQVTHAEHEVGRVEAQHKVLHLQYQRLEGVAKAKPGLVAQQEVDDAQGKDLASEAQIEESNSTLDAARSQLAAAQAKREHDSALYNYSKITAPFAGVVTQRYANLGTLMQAGTSSSTQAMPLVRLSEDDKFRLVIPVPESYVRFIHIGDPVDVHVASLNRNFQGRVARFSVDVREDTRTMHTEVDLANTGEQLMPGLYAEATLTLEKKLNALAVPLQAVNHEGDTTTVYVIDRANKLEDQTVVLGLQTASEAEVVEGLKDGDQVVVSDRSGLKPGQEVQPQTIQLIQYQGQKEE